jgi:hypothetical protein
VHTLSEEVTISVCPRLISRPIPLRHPHLPLPPSLFTSPPTSLLWGFADPSVQALLNYYERRTIKSNFYPSH